MNRFTWRGRVNGPHQLGHLRVSVLPGGRFRGRLIAGTTIIPCVIGPAGLSRRKREGDGTTPVGCFALTRLLVRRDRGPLPRTGLPTTILRRQDGWCDDPGVPCYNRPIALPARAGHERLWRSDGLYDHVVVIDYNLRPVRKGLGSAIFLHVQAAPDQPTAGCVAIELRALRRLLPRLGPRTVIIIG